MQLDSLSLKLNGKTIKRVNNFKFLGFIIDEHLSWKAHMLEILSKIQRNASIVKKIACFLNRDSLMQLFHSLIVSHIRYGITLWHHSHIEVRRKIQACANKFLRLIYFLNPRDSVENLMKDNNILSVNQMYTFEVAKNMQRLALKDVPNSFLSIFDPQFRIPNMSLRSTSNYLPAPSSSDKAQQCIRFTGPNIWNKLPVHIRKTSMKMKT